MEILVVDDSPTLQQCVGEYLNHSAYVICYASSGQEAIDAVLKSPPDIILMDVEMSGMNGFEATQKIRQIPNLGWFPIIFVTGRNDDTGYQEGIDAGGDDYLTKPVHPIILNAKITSMARIINMQRQLSMLAERLANSAITDELTGIINRKGLAQQGKQLWAQASREQETISVIMIDIDFFKPYNDTYGHTTGDECLHDVAQAINNTLHRPMDFACRYGGEEFVVILPHTDSHGAKKVAEKLLSAVEQLNIQHVSSKVKPFVTLSLGISSCRSPQKRSLEELISTADDALYESKENGRNQFTYAKLKNKRKILVVDDDRSTLMLLEDMLSEDYDVKILQDGTKATSISDEVHPDLILLDIEMPNINGFEICETLKSQGSTKHIPVLFISAQDKAKQIPNSKRSGAAGFISKPICEDKLLTRINSFF